MKSVAGSLYQPYLGSQFSRLALPSAREGGWCG